MRDVPHLDSSLSGLVAGLPQAILVRLRGPSHDSTHTLAEQQQKLAAAWHKVISGNADHLVGYWTLGEADAAFVALTERGQRGLEALWQEIWGKEPGTCRADGPDQPLGYLCRAAHRVPGGVTVAVGTLTPPAAVFMTFCRGGSDCPNHPGILLDSFFRCCHLLPVQTADQLKWATTEVINCRSSGTQTFSVTGVLFDQRGIISATSDFLVELTASDPNLLASRFFSAKTSHWMSLGRRDHRLYFQDKSLADMISLLGEAATGVVSRRCWQLMPPLLEAASSLPLGMYRVPPPFFLPSVAGGLDLTSAHDRARATVTNAWRQLESVVGGTAPRPPSVVFIPEDVGGPNFLQPYSDESPEIRIPWPRFCELSRSLDRGQSGAIDWVVEHEIAHALAAMVFKNLPRGYSILGKDPDPRELIIGDLVLDVFELSGEEHARVYTAVATDLFSLHRLRPAPLPELVTSLLALYERPGFGPPGAGTESLAAVLKKVAGGALIYARAVGIEPSTYVSAIADFPSKMSIDERKSLGSLISLNLDRYKLDRHVSKEGAKHWDVCLVGDAVDLIWNLLALHAARWWAAIHNTTPLARAEDPVWRQYIRGATHLAHATWLADDAIARTSEVDAWVQAETSDLRSWSELFKLFLERVASTPSRQSTGVFGERGPMIDVRGIRVGYELLAVDGKTRYPQLLRTHVERPLLAYQGSVNWDKALDDWMISIWSGSGKPAPRIGAREVLELRMDVWCIEQYTLSVSGLLPRAEPGSLFATFNLRPLWFVEEGQFLAEAFGLAEKVRGLRAALTQLSYEPICEITEGVIGGTPVELNRLRTLGLDAITLGLDDLFGQGANDPQTHLLIRTWDPQIRKLKVACEVVKAWTERLGEDDKESASLVSRLSTILRVLASHCTLWHFQKPVVVVVEGMSFVSDLTAKEPHVILEAVAVLLGDSVNVSLIGQLKPEGAPTAVAASKGESASAGGPPAAS